jgi:hypothetical protein
LGGSLRDGDVSTTRKRKRKRMIQRVSKRRRDPRDNVVVLVAVAEAAAAVLAVFQVAEVGGTGRGSGATYSTKRREMAVMAKIRRGRGLGHVDCGGVVGLVEDAEEAEYHGGEEDADYSALRLGAGVVGPVHEDVQEAKDAGDVCAAGADVED